jgi:hypothetical protein
MAREIGKVPVQDLTEFDYFVLGIGINQSSNRGGIFHVNYTTINQAKDNLKNLILTRKGERVMQPTFGCDIWKLLFEAIDGEDLENRIEQTIIEAVSIWLPYIQIDQIIFDYDNNDIDNHRIILEIKFSLTTNPNINSALTINVQ